MYENDHTLKREDAIINAVAEKWKCSRVKLPIKINADYGLIRDGQFKALAEVKDRSYSYKSLAAKGGYMISAHKVERIFAFCELALIPFVLIACLDGVIWHVSLYREKPKKTQLDLFDLHEIDRASTWRSHWRLAWFGGNREFRREGDCEPVFMIPMASWARFENG